MLLIKVSIVITIEIVTQLSFSPSSRAGSFRSNLLWHKCRRGTSLLAHRYHGQRRVYGLRDFCHNSATCYQV